MGFFAFTMNKQIIIFNSYIHRHIAVICADGDHVDAGQRSGISTGLASLKQIFRRIDHRTSVSPALSVPVPGKVEFGAQPYDGIRVGQRVDGAIGETSKNPIFRKNVFIIQLKLI